MTGIGILFKSRLWTGKKQKFSGILGSKLVRCSGCFLSWPIPSSFPSRASMLLFGGLRVGGKNLHAEDGEDEKCKVKKWNMDRSSVGTSKAHILYWHISRFIQCPICPVEYYVEYDCHHCACQTSNTPCMHFIHFLNFVVQQNMYETFCIYIYILLYYTYSYI